MVFVPVSRFTPAGRYRTCLSTACAALATRHTLVTRTAERLGLCSLCITGQRTAVWRLQLRPACLRVDAKRRATYTSRRELQRVANPHSNVTPTLDGGAAGRSTHAHALPPSAPHWRAFGGPRALRTSRIGLDARSQRVREAAPRLPRLPSLPLAGTNREDLPDGLHRPTTEPQRRASETA